MAVLAMPIAEAATHNPSLSWNGAQRQKPDPANPSYVGTPLGRQTLSAKSAIALARVATRDESDEPRLLTADRCCTNVGIGRKREGRRWPTRRLLLRRARTDDNASERPPLPDALCAPLRTGRRAAAESCGRSAPR